MATTHAVGGKPRKAESSIAAIAAAGPTKKPVVKVLLPYNNSPIAAVATPVKHTPVKPVIKIISKPQQTRRVEPSKVKINPEKRKNITLKRKFSEKKITVKIENASKVRKTRDAIRRKVANMKLEEVTAKLSARGLARPNAKIPEEMQRSMLVDVMMFPVPV